jgi:SAM-dependent methyltransferase
MDRRARILRHVDWRAGAGLEIGPLASPLLSKQESAVRYLDFFSTEQLKQNYLADPNVDVAKIVDIDFVSAGRSIRESIGAAAPLDFVVASHVIEHVPNLIGWLCDVSASIRAGGRLALAVPDRRFTFDFRREETRFREILNPYFHDYRSPSPAQQYDFLSQVISAPSAADVWAGRTQPARAPSLHGAEEAMALVRHVWQAGSYSDSHCTVFTDASFLALLGELMRHDLVDFKLVHFEATDRDNFEFYATLEKMPVMADATLRRRLQADSLAPFLSRATDSTAAAAPAAPPAAGRGALDFYHSASPGRNSAFDLFAGEWVCEIPGIGLGSVPAFEDVRIRWLVAQAGGLAGKSVLELGPLEAGHTHMMAAAGADPILAIESNSRAFLKCLIVKSAFDLKAELLLGDFRKFLATTDRHFDFLLASGVLYHMSDPLSLIEDACRIADRIGIWTHYFDEGIIRQNSVMAPKFTKPPRLVAYKDRNLRLHEQSYMADVESPIFCGGAEPVSYWMERADILALFELNGFRVVPGDENVAHPHGPCLLLYAQRQAICAKS